MDRLEYTKPPNALTPASLLVEGDDHLSPIDSDEQAAMRLFQAEPENVADSTPSPEFDDQVSDNRELSRAYSVPNVDLRAVLAKIESTIFGIVKDLTREGPEKKSLVDIFYRRDRIQGIGMLLVTVGILGLIIKALQ